MLMHVGHFVSHYFPEDYTNQYSPTLYCNKRKFSMNVGSKIPVVKLKKSSFLGKIGDFRFIPAQFVQPHKVISHIKYDPVFDRE